MFSATVDKLPDGLKSLVRRKITKCELRKEKIK